MKNSKILGVVLFSVLLIIGLFSTEIFSVVKKASSTVETTISTTYPTTELTTESTTESTTHFINADVPYEGMPESNINSTRLGRATEVKKCRDFYKLKESHRYTEYVWKQNDKTIFKATVWYWDYKNDRADRKSVV